MTLKEGGNKGEVKEGPRMKLRSRRVEPDLRKRVLKDQTCKLLFNSPNEEEEGDVQEKKIAAPPTVEEKKLPEILGKENQGEQVRQQVRKEDLPRLTCEEKVLRIRKRLERIIHKKEEDEGKAVELLATLDRMRIPGEVLNTTKIDLTIEALQFLVKEKAVVEKAKCSLVKLRAGVAGPAEKKAVSSVGDIKDKHVWRDSSKERNGEREKQRVATGKYRHNYKRKEDKTGEKGKVAEVVLPTSEDNSATGAESAATTTNYADSLPSLNVGYWMDRLLNGVEKLSVLDQKVGKLQENVEKEKTAQEKKQQAIKTTEDNTAAIKAAKGKEKKKHNENCDVNVFEDELIMLTKKIQNIGIKEKEAGPAKNSTAKPTVAVKEAVMIVPDKKIDLPTEKPCKAEDVIEKVEKIKTVLDSFAEQDSHTIIDCLNNLSSLNLPVSILVKTKIGMSVNAVRKGSDNADVCSAAKNLVRAWKKLLPSGGSDEVPATGGTTATTPASTEGPSTQATPEAIRAHCRKQLCSALASNNTLSESCKLFAEQLAGEIEAEIFSMFKETNQKYRGQVNSRFFNIKKNTTLQENLLLGNLSAIQVARMSYQDLASDEVREVRAKLEEECLKAVPESHANDGMCTCRICLPPWIANK